MFSIISFFFLGIIFVMIYGLIKAGGVAEVFRVSNNGDRLSVFNMSFDPTIRTTFWGAFLPFFVSKCLNQQKNFSKVDEIVNKTHLLL